MQRDPQTTILEDTDGPHMRRCSRCHRIFKSRKSADTHIQWIHKGKGERISARRIEREPSMGTLVAEAQIAKASGEPVDPWIETMFGEYL